MTTLPLDLNIVGERWYVERTTKIVTKTRDLSFTRAMAPPGTVVPLGLDTRDWFGTVPLDRLWMVERVSCSMIVRSGGPATLSAVMLDIADSENDADDVLPLAWSALAAGGPATLGYNFLSFAQMALNPPVKVPAGSELRVRAAAALPDGGSGTVGITFTTRAQVTVLRRQPPAS